MAKKKIDKILCANCNRITSHDIICEESEYYTPSNYPEMQIDFADGKWEILKCRGCDDVTFRETWMTSEDTQPTVQLYPLRSESFRKIRDYYKVPRDIRRIYQEVIKCYKNDIKRLCAAGLRALIEGICVDNKVKSGQIETKDKSGKKKTVRRKTLEGKIEGLVEKNILTRKYADILNELRFMGNESLHQLEEPEDDELRLAIDIVEHTLENLYEIPNKGNELRETRKLRKEIFG